MRHKIEVAANVVFILAAVILVSILVKNHFGPGSEGFSIERGDNLLSPPGYEWRSHHRTLVLALRNGCRFCENSMPFYRKLAEMERTHQLDAHILAVFPDDPKIVHAVLDAEQLQAEFLSGVSLGSLKVSSTPTLMLIDQDGRVLNLWVGQLPVAGEEDVLNSMKKPSDVSLKSNQ